MTDRWHDWDPPTAPATNSRSYGVNPSSFYLQEPNIDSLSSTEKKLGDILRLAASNEIVQKRKEYTSIQRIKTEAYHDATSFKVFPLQDLATDHLQEMLKGYLGEERSATQTQEDINCKRRKTEHMNIIMHHPSDDMNGMKEKCTATFLAENDYLPPNDMKNGVSKADRYRFLPELWSMEPRVFALEISSTGKRRYIVAQLGRFMQHYWRESDPQSRHYYELIREGCPCRLYFDLEFSKELNPHITSSESEMLMTEFIEELCGEFQMEHTIQIDRTCIVDLDSSTEKKFSRHLIIHLPNGELFADACAAGVFAKRFVGRLAEELAMGVLAKRRATLARHLFVNNKAVEDAADCAKRGLNKTCFVDLGVYTRNRLFRLMASMKYGKSASAALRIASANKFRFPDGFDNSKICLNDKAPPGASNDDRPLNGSNLRRLPRKERLPSSLSQDHDAFCAALDWEAHAKALAMSLVVPANSTKIPAPVLIEPNAGASCRKPTPIPSVHRQPPKASSRICHGDSPIPKLDKFILEISKRGGIQGEIRAWSYSDSRHMTYHMARNRWCENIGRPHKSNNIMWLTDLTNKVYWQQCHDEECRMMNFRGRSKELPEDVATDIDAFLLDQELAELDEDEIINRAKIQTHGDDLEFDDSELDSALRGLDMSRFTQDKPAPTNAHGKQNSFLS